MIATATTKDAYKLLHNGSLVMAEMERNGIHVDVDYVKYIQERIQHEVTRLTTRLEKDKVYRIWKHKYGYKMKLSSRTQLADILFNVMQIPTTELTEKKRYKADEEVLEGLDIPFIKRYLKIEKLKKAKNTYLANILRETCNGILHPNFNLHFARTYRSSSDHPNFQNLPKHDPLIQKLVRRSLITRSGCQIVDIDFKGSEICGAAWYHKDPMMLKYIKDTSKDLHRDMAQEIYILPKKQMTKAIRHCGKNMFVFPQFYGDWWLSCAKNLWNAIDRMNLETTDGIPLKKWLKKNGITELGTGNSKKVKPNSFEAHLKRVEYAFWHKRFNKYHKWKEKWWEDYQSSGFFQMLTGFVVTGDINRKDCINYPVQGTAFHCLLWCLIRLNELLQKYKMKTKLIGQIHDSIVSDTPEKEFKDYLELAQEVITVQLKKHWPWIITPMRIEVSTTPVDGNWYEAKEYEI
jgi:DNA polymerase I-like protein with 3'-5' exonuclease and polymerase domains